ncbi:MAG: hypothetical protein K2X87_10560 [Gemmataceae bacterium]|nr:hypothetical protein [Gemmataceae bacterium]
MPACSVAVLAAAVSAFLPPGPALEIELRLDKSKVYAGDTVRLQELIPKRTGLEFGGLHHEAVRIGKYDKLGRLTNLEYDLYEVVRCDDSLFGVLPCWAVVTPALNYTVHRGGWKGIEFVFTPTEPGVYLIFASWGTGDQWITGSPVVLTVRPKPPEK